MKKKEILIRVIILFIGLAIAHLGGTLWIGTIICAAVVGPVAGLFMPFNEGIINRILGKYLKH